MSEPLKWYDDNADNPPWIKALAEVRRLAPREGWCFQRVQAIIVSIDQYAESALGYRSYFLNRPYSIGPSRKACRECMVGAKSVGYPVIRQRLGIRSGAASGRRASLWVAC
jgi:hypothetical protein